MLLSSSLGFCLVKPSRTRSANTARRSWQNRLIAGALSASVLTISVWMLGNAAHRAIALPLTADTARSKMTFDQLMDVGYAASRQGDLNTALINFRRALALRPGNSYAAAAADNMAYYIEHARITARQWEITKLETRLTNAINQKDWVCAATTLDELTMYTKPNSLNRARLIGQRGEVTGRLDSRLDHEAWSTVCTAQRPVY